jgi:hypothetical protein
MSPAKKAAAKKGADEKLKHADHTAWRRVEKESIILDLNTSVYYSLNETGAFVWERLGAGDAVAQVVAGLSAEFDVKADVAERDVAELIQELREQKLLIPA